MATNRGSILEANMKMGRMTVAVGSLLALCMMCEPTWAQTVRFPMIARSYVAWMVRAFDQCAVPNVTAISGSGLPTSGCLATNLTSDSTITMGFARLIVSTRSRRAVLYGRGFHFGDRVRLQLTLRVSQNGVNTKSLGKKNVTYSDITVHCPSPTSAPFGFVARLNGAIVATADLATQCDTPTGLAAGNIEIVNAALLNIDNANKPFAVPGVLR